MIQHVYDRCMQSIADQVIIATDNQDIFEVCKSFGADVKMTGKHHRSGTDRCIEVAMDISGADYIMNVQGDEPLIDPSAINDLFERIIETGSEICTLIRESHDYDVLRDPDVVKCVTDRQGRALYFSRSPIPYPRNATSSSSPVTCFLHVGIYAFKREALLKIGRLNFSFLEETEKLEQLRWLEHGMDIWTARTTYQSIGVDHPRDVSRVEEILRKG